MNHVFKSFLFFLLIAVNCLQELACSQLINQKSLQIVLSLSQNAQELYTKPNATDDPVYLAVENALCANQIVIVSSTILHWLAKRTEEGRDGGKVSWLQRLDGKYYLFLGNDEDFALLVPKDRSAALECYGFNKESLQKPLLTAAAMESCFAAEKFEEQEVVIDHLATLFSNRNSCAKCWYVVGHGLDSIDDEKYIWAKSRVVQLEIYQIVQLLQFFNTVNTKAAFVVSCYDAGKNCLKIQNLLSGKCRDERCPINCDLTYPLFIQGTTDMPTSLVLGFYCPFGEMEAALADWSQRGNQEEEFLQVISAFYAKIPADDRFFNYPIVRMSSKNALFKAVALPTAAVIDKSPKKTATIDVTNAFDAIQIYPADLQAITVHLQDPELPRLVSRVMGSAHHFLGSIQVDAQGDLQAILANCFLYAMTTNHDGDVCVGVADKCWFINEVMAAGKKIARGVVVHKGSLKAGVPLLEVVYQDEQGRFHRILRTVQTDEKYHISSNELNQEAYSKAVQRMYWETLPSADAVSEAMGDQETLEDHQRLFKQFGQSINISLVPADESSLIREDFAKIRSSKLNKDTYINYAAYTGNRAIITRMIDDVLSGVTFDADDIMLLLQHLIDHEQAAVAVEAIKRLASQDDPAMLTCMLYVFSYLIDQSLLMQAVAAYDDIITCTRTVMKLTRSAKQSRRLLVLIQDKLTQLMVALVQKNHADIAVEKVLALLAAPELGLQGFGLVLIKSMQAEGFTNARLEAKKGLLTAIAMRLEAAVHEGNIVAAYFSQQAMVKTYTHCLTA